MKKLNIPHYHQNNVNEGPSLVSDTTLLKVESPSALVEIPLIAKINKIWKKVKKSKNLLSS